MAGFDISEISHTGRQEAPKSGTTLSIMGTGRTAQSVWRVLEGGKKRGCQATIEPVTTLKLTLIDGIDARTLDRAVIAHRLHSHRSVTVRSVVNMARLDADQKPPIGKDLKPV